MSAGREVLVLEDRRLVPDVGLRDGFGVESRLFPPVRHGHRGSDERERDDAGDEREDARSAHEG
ncbi:MAG: hypothetical protein ACOC0F_03015 [archaeon]